MFRNPTLVILADLRDEVEATVREPLQRFGDDVTARVDGSHIPFESIQTLHSARILILPPDGASPSRLLFSTVFDGPEDAHLSELVSKAGAMLESLFKNCRDYPDVGSSLVLKEYMRSHRIFRRAFHIGAVGYTVAEIKEEEKLRRAIADFVDECRLGGTWKHNDPERIHKDILTFVLGHSDLPHQARSPIPFRVRFAKFWDLITVSSMLILPLFIGALLLNGTLFHARHPWMAIPLGMVLLAVLALVLLAIIVRLHEINETPDKVSWLNVDVDPVLHAEDRLGQNQISLVIPVKSGWFRAIMMRLVLWTAHALSCHVWNRGLLVGVSTIHFARFFLIDGGRRMMFLSHYDGSWDRYLADFLTVGAFAVVPIWTNLEGCPSTRFLIWPAEGFAQQFLPFIRNSQIVSQVWYTAYPDVSLENIRQNAEIRKGLFAPIASATSKEWLSLL